MFAVALPVFAGMTFASLFGVFLIPVMYVAVQRVREWAYARNATKAEPPSGPHVIPGE